VLRARDIFTLLAMAACGSWLCFSPARANGPAPAAVRQGQPPEQVAAPTANGLPGKLMVTVGKSLIIDSPLRIERISVANGDLAEAVAVRPNEVLINGKAPGETSLIVWQLNGARLIYDLTVRLSTQRLDAVRQQIARDFPNSDINVTFENDTAFVRGTVKDTVAADRVMAIATTLGKAINLLRVEMPAVEQQVLLKVRFADIDRSAELQLGTNFFTGAFNQLSNIGTGSPLATTTGGTQTINVGTAVNILLQRANPNIAVAIQALQSKNLLEMLAEPNLLAISGQTASFLAGGEFPFPMVQPSTGTQAVSIMWREYGVRLSFLPTVTPRGTIRLKVAPEVSSLDYTNAVTVEGVTVPGLSSRRVQTEVELESGQTFVIAGLLDHQTTDNLSKIPGISSIPVLGKLFQSKQTTRNNSELLVIITPELVRPIPADGKVPELPFKPGSMLPTDPDVVTSQPGMDKTGPVPVKPTSDTIPVETLRQNNGPAPAAGSAPIFQMVPVAPAPAAPPVNPGLTPPAMATPGGTGK
jgi:pilus assembly protein CpaC